MRLSLLTALLFTGLLTGCGDSIGAPCEFKGSGFTASTNCRHRCLQHRPVTCPGEKKINPHICSGSMGCKPGGCGEGEVCYTVQDPFDEESFCVPANICGSTTEDILSQWEVDTSESAAVLRAKWEEKKKRMNQIPKPTAPAVDLDNS